MPKVRIRFGRDMKMGFIGSGAGPLSGSDRAHRLGQENPGPLGPVAGGIEFRSCDLEGPRHVYAVQP